MMKIINLSFLLISLGCSLTMAQDDSDDYLEFNDRNNVVHGVYLGLTMGYGEIDRENAYMGGLKIAYVANQQFEVGFEGKFLYSDQDLLRGNPSFTEDLVGGYGGLHLEPIFFSKSRVNLSLPILIGGGYVGYVNDAFKKDSFNGEQFDNDAEAFFFIEPGVSALFNISRYLQLEAGLKYRLTSEVRFTDSQLSNLNGFSTSIGVKVGIFNMGRNRYKKNIN